MTKAQLQEAYNLVTAALSEREEEVAQLENRITELETQLKDITKATTQGRKPRPSLPEPFEYRGTIYRFSVAAVFIDGQKHTTASLSANAELLDKILAQRGQRILEVVEKG